MTDENKIVQLAFIKVLDILGNPSCEFTLRNIEKKYGFPILNGVRPITSSEIEETIMEMFGTGGELIIRLLRAEVQRLV